MKQSTYANIRDEKNTRLCTPLLQFFSTRFARINLLTRAWFDREKGGCPFRIQYKTRRIHLSPLSLSLSLPQPCRFPFYPSLSGFPAMISDVRRRRPNGNVKVTWRRCVLVAVAYFSSTWNRYARIHLSYDTSIWERDQDRPTEPIPVNPAINYNRSRVRTFNVLQITVATVWRDYVRYQTRINYLSGE